MSTRRHCVLHMLAFVGMATLVYVLLDAIVPLGQGRAELGAVVAGATAALVNALVTY